MRRPKCAKDDCTFQCCLENSYCKKHAVCVFVDELKKENKKPCVQYIRGCRESLAQDDRLSKCTSCREKERKNDHEKRNRIKIQNETQSTALKTEKQCNTCTKLYPIDQFKGERQKETKTCFTCRTNNKKQDLIRDHEKRKVQGRVYDSEKLRKVRKKEWKDENYDKCAMAWMNYRERQMNENQDEYLRKCAEQQKLWREQNPEKMIVLNESHKKSSPHQYQIYLKNALVKNVEFSLTLEDFQTITNNNCFYCDEMNYRGFQGIDRIDQTVGYIQGNCVPCCKMCNYMKGSLHENMFLKRVEHIMTHQGKIKGRLHPECFANHQSCNYISYKHRADKKQLAFLINEKVFEETKQNPCYICGKSIDKSHMNGIDRYDNTKGYELENIRSCCGECNTMKKTFPYDSLINKIEAIYTNHKDIFLFQMQADTSDLNNSIIVKNKNKTEGVKIVKAKQKVPMNETDKLNHAKELFEIRKIRNRQIIIS